MCIMNPSLPKLHSAKGAISSLNFYVRQKLYGKLVNVFSGLFLLTIHWKMILYHYLSLVLCYLYVLNTIVNVSVS